MIHLRAQQPALSLGSMRRLDTDPRNHVLGFVREHADDKVLVLLNYSEKPLKLDLDTGLRNGEWNSLLQHQPKPFKTNAKGRLKITVQGLQAVILKLKP